MLCAVRGSSVLGVLRGTCTVLVTVGRLLLLASLLFTAFCATLLEEGGAKCLVVKGFFAEGTESALNFAGCGIGPPVILAEANEAEVELLGAFIALADRGIYWAVRRPVAAFSAAEYACSVLWSFADCADKWTAVPLS